VQLREYTATILAGHTGTTLSRWSFGMFGTSFGTHCFGLFQVVIHEAVVFRLTVPQVLAVAVHNHYKRLQNKRMHRAQEAQLQQQAAMVSYT
jgi:uncharacterized membrane protein